MLRRDLPRLIQRQELSARPRWAAPGVVLGRVHISQYERGLRPDLASTHHTLATSTMLKRGSTRRRVRARGRTRSCASSRATSSRAFQASSSCSKRRAVCCRGR